MMALLEQKYDPRFVFSEWNQPLMDRLQSQQEELKLKGINRQVCVLVDDIVMTGRDEDQLAHLCLRGRHFNISVLAASVSYTCLPKRSRRSLDCLFLYSCPMAGDCAILCQEYANRARMARYCLQNLPEYTCLVMETLERQQRLYHYKVQLSPQRDYQTPESPPGAPDGTSAAAETPEHSQTACRPEKIDEASRCTEDLESGRSDEEAGS